MERRPSMKEETAAGEKAGAGSSVPAASRRKDTRRQTGRLGEQAAAEKAEACGFRILHRNWRCRTGELDVVAMDGETLVFIEVRTRTGTAVFGTPQESVDGRKQRQVRNTAQVYIHNLGKYEYPIRFDLISIVMDREGSIRSIDHLPNAF